MKRLPKHSSWALILISASVALAAFDRSNWKFFKPLDVEPSAGFVRVEVDEETFHNARPDLADLRVVTESGTEHPYHIVRGTEWSERQTHVARVYNLSESPQGYVQVLLDLGRGGIPHNTVELVIDDRNFRRRVEVYGSDNNRTWNLLRRDAAVFDLSTVDDTVRQTQVRFPESVFRYLKVHVMNDGEKPLGVKSATVSIESAPGREMRDHAATIMATEDNATLKRSIVWIDAGGKNLPLCGMSLVIPTDNFYRSVIVYAGNDTSAMKRVGSDVLFRFSTSRYKDERLQFDFPTTAARYLKFVINNKDDQPLAISGVTLRRLVYHLVFKSPEESLLLYLGNEQAVAPQYDLVRTLRYVDLADAVTGSAGPLETNPAFEEHDTRPWSERNPLLLWAAFGILFLTLAFLILRLARKGQKHSAP